MNESKKYKLKKDIVLPGTVIKAGEISTVNEHGLYCFKEGAFNMGFTGYEVDNYPDWFELVEPINNPIRWSDKAMIDFAFTMVENAVKFYPNGVVKTYIADMLKAWKPDIKETDVKQYSREDMIEFGNCLIDPLRPQNLDDAFCMWYNYRNGIATGLKPPSALTDDSTLNDYTKKSESAATGLKPAPISVSDEEAALPSTPPGFNDTVYHSSFVVKPSLWTDEQLKDYAQFAGDNKNNRATVNMFDDWKRFRGYSDEAKELRAVVDKIIVEQVVNDSEGVKPVYGMSDEQVVDFIKKYYNVRSNCVGADLKEFKNRYNIGQGSTPQLFTEKDMIEFGDIARKRFGKTVDLFKEWQDDKNREIILPHSKNGYFCCSIIVMFYALSRILCFCIIGILFYLFGRIAP